jgi:hypothetical protein
MLMNAGRRRASDRVQRARSSLVVTIGAPAIRPATASDRRRQERPMLKTVSATLVAMSLLAAPAMATTVIKTGHGPAARTVIVKPSVAKARAQVVVVKKVRPHRHHRAARVYHPHHKPVVVVKKRHF